MINKIERYYLTQNKTRFSTINSLNTKKRITLRAIKKVSLKKRSGEIKNKDLNDAKAEQSEDNKNINSSEEDRLQIISSEVINCVKCELHKTRTNVVFGKGSCKPEIVFIGEAPGAEEDKLGLPFVGRGGKLLDSWLLKINLDLERVYIMNAIKCRPPQNRDPTEFEKTTCRIYFDAQLEILSPKIICALGRHAFGNLVKFDSKESYGKMRGKLHYYKSIPVVATYHPAFILRSPSFADKVYEDLALLISESKKL